MRTSCGSCVGTGGRTSTRGGNWLHAQMFSQLFLLHFLIQVIINLIENSFMIVFIHMEDKIINWGPILKSFCLRIHVRGQLMINSLAGLEIFSKKKIYFWYCFTPQARCLRDCPPGQPCPAGGVRGGHRHLQHARWNAVPAASGGRGLRDIYRYQALQEGKQDIQP